MTDEHRLLRGYPAQWRARYGAELLAMVEDVSAGRTPSPRLRATLFFTGLKERLREQALIGRDRPPVDRVRAGSRVILVAWSVLVVAGCGFAKFSEHWSSGVPIGDRLVPNLMYGAIVVLAAVGAISLLAVTATALPSLRRAVSGLWRPIRGSIITAFCLSALVGASTVALAVSARHLSAVQRNGSSTIYLAAFVGWVLLVVAMIGAWTTAAIVVERRLDLSPSCVRAMRLCARIMTWCTVMIAGAIITWWIALAQTAPWVLGAHQVGTATSAWAWPLPGIAGAAVAAAAVAVLGSTRLLSAARSERMGPLGRD